MVKSQSRAVPIYNVHTDSPIKKTKIENTRDAKENKPLEIKGVNLDLSEMAKGDLTDGEFERY